MADIKISALPSAPLDGTEIVPTVDGGANARTTTQAIANLAPIQDHGSLVGLADDDHAQYHTDARGDARYSPLGHGHTNASGAAAGFMSSTDKNKLDGLATGSTANSSDAFLLARANHTGVQAIATITNLQAALDALGYAGARVYKNTSSNFTVQGTTVYTPNTEVHDVGGWWNPGSPTLFTVPAGVAYVELGAELEFVMSGTARELNFLLTIKKNGSLFYRNTLRIPPGLQIATYSNVASPKIFTGPVAVAASDTFSLEITIQDPPNTGFNVSLNASGSTDTFWIRKVG